MQGVSIWGLFLALAQLLQCGTNFAVTGEAKQDDLFGSISVQKGLQALFDMTLEEATAKSLEENIMDVFNKSVVYEKPRKKPTGFNVKKPWPIPANKTRSKRQVSFENELERIITLKPVVQGTDEPRTDNCEREEILHEDGDCYEILSQGPCEDNEYVLVDLTTRKGFCATRLCSPDRVFVFEDQKCHNPFENDICPPGRQLSTSCYGTPVCLCPDGTYEEEDDADEDVCKPILSQIDNCNFGEVFWFTSFRSEPMCIPDPCPGLNSKRSFDELPYIPSSFDGKCYQVGKEVPHCPSDTLYTISFHGLKGVCASLEEAGYLVADEDVLQSFASRYGPPLEKDIASFSFSTKRHQVSSKPSKTKRHQTSSLKHRENEEEEEQEEIESTNRVREAKGLSTKGISKGLLNFLLQAARESGLHRASISRARAASSRKTVKPSRRKLVLDREEEEQDEQEIEEEESHSRKKRDSFPFASPSNVFEPALATCRAGAIRGLNNRCRTRVLPSRRPLSRPKRRAPPTRPIPSCPLGHFYTIGNRCVNNNGQIQANLLSQGLG